MNKKYEAKFYDWVPSGKPKIPPSYKLVSVIQFMVDERFNGGLIGMAFRRVHPRYLDSVWCEVERVG